MGIITRHPPASERPGIKITRIWVRRLRDRLLTLLLIMQIFILFIMPAVRASALITVPHIATYSLLLIFVALAIILSRSKIAIAMLVVSVVLTAAGIVWHAQQPGLTANAIGTTGQVLTQASLLWVVTTAVFGSGPVTYHRIMGAVVMYLCIGMIFTSLDILIARSLPGAFTNLPASSNGLREAMTYFSFSSLTTGNFGDIIPVHPIARSLANLESICGQLFPATLLARIVGMHTLSRGK